MNEKHPPKNPNSAAAPEWLAGGGELAERIRVFDWSATPLGPLPLWPQSLKTSVNLILNSRHPMWIGWGPEATFLYNDAYISVLGAAKHPSALGRPAAEVWAEIWDICGPLAEKVFQKGEATFVSEVRLFMDRGAFREETYYSFSYSPIRDESGRVAGLFCPSAEGTAKNLNIRRTTTLSDLAAKALVEKTVPAACATAASSLEKNPDDIPFALIFLNDHEGRPRLQQAVGYSGQSSEFLQFVAEAISGKKPQIISVNNIDGLPAGPGNQAVNEAMVLPIVVRGADCVGALVAGINPARPMDTEYRAFFILVANQVATAIANATDYEEERKRAAELAALDRAKTTFFSNVSHEFRTPLTLMLGPLEDLLVRAGAELSPAARADLELVHRNSLRLLRLVNALLEFSRIEAGRVEASYEATDLAAFTAELASVFRAATDRAGLGLTVYCAKLPGPVFVDKEMWEKIVLNLISNAFKFTFAGKISVSLKNSGDSAELRVRDTRVGIAPEGMARLFERFHRIEQARSRTHEGSGIGLALVQELVKLHGGSVRAESILGTGTTFIVTIPLGRAHLPPERVGRQKQSESPALAATAFVEEALRWLPGEPDPEPAAALSANANSLPAIIIAEDNADMRGYLTRLLSPRYNVTAVADGEAALLAARTQKPELILSDVMMPRLDGFGLVKALRADARLQTVPIILLSARAGEESRVEGLDSGADDYLIKPFSARELLARVESNLKLAQARTESARQLETLVARRTAQLRDTIEDLEAFSYSIAHDMRAPLRALQSYGEFLRAEYFDKIDATGQNYLTRITASAARMDLLIRDILNYSKIVRGELPLQAVDVEKLLQSIIVGYPDLQDSPIQIEGPIPTVLGNEAALTQCLSNLLGNAVKFATPGAKPLIRIRAETGPNRVKLFIQDNGIGIDPSQHEKIFAIFQRVSRQYDGTGIGLAIVKKAVERMGGTVGLTSQLGQGSTFWIEIALAGPISSPHP